MEKTQREKSLYPIVLCAYVVVSLLALSATALEQFKKEDFQRANEAVVRLSPNNFPSLPSEVRADLEKRGCTVPQPFGSGSEKKNVVSGHFTSGVAKDWAVLCSHSRQSAILVFRGGKSKQVDEIAAQADIDCLQVVARGREIGFSRQLAVAAPKTIHRLNADHDGIEDAFLEKGSLIWFFVNGKWTRLASAD